MHSITPRIQFGPEIFNPKYFFILFFKIINEHMRKAISTNFIFLIKKVWIHWFCPKFGNTDPSRTFSGNACKVPQVNQSRASFISTNRGRPWAKVELWILFPPHMVDCSSVGPLASLALTFIVNRGPSAPPPPSHFSFVAFNWLI
jgi:hypothetical protein